MSAPLRYLPLWPGTNRPAIREWPVRASSDPDHWREWGEQIPGCNWGILTGHGLGVLDIDTKSAPEWSFGGFGSLTDLEDDLALDLSDLPKVSTPSGAHLYFRYDGHLPSRVPWLPHLDVKADKERQTGGHQVAAPGSVRQVNGEHRVYTLVRGSLDAIPYAPDALLGALRDSRGWRGSNGGGSPSPGADLPLTAEALENGLPTSSRNDFMHRLACRWWSKLGLDAEAEVYGLARSVWTATPGHDTFPWAEAEKCVESARRFITTEDYNARQIITAWLHGGGRT